MKRKNLFGIIIVALIFVGVIWYFQTNDPRSESDSNSLEKLTVQAGWLLNGEFANVCSAIVNGYYEDKGLDVEMLPGGPSGASFILATNAIAQNDELDIGIEGDLVPIMRGVTKENENERLKVRAFGSFWTDLPYGFMVREDSELYSLKDFAKTKPDGTKYKIGVTADAVIQNAIADYAGVNVEDLEIVIVGFDATPILTGDVDALAGFWTTQAYELEQAGFDYRFLNVSELPGWEQPSMIALATEKTLSEKKDQLVKWMEATIEGAEFVYDNPGEAAKHILDERCGGQTFDETQEKWLIEKSLDLFDMEKYGSISEDQIKNFGQAYYDLGQIPYAPESSEIIDNSILNKIY